MIELRRLQALRLVHQHGTVTSAARTLHLTPSAVSQQIRQLSGELGVDLLEPRGRRVQLTPAARALLAHADDLHAQWERARADLQSYANGLVGPLRIGGFPSSIVTLIAPAAARLRATHPQLDLFITETETANSFDLLLADQVDLAVIVPTPGTPTPDDPRFDQRPLLDEPQDLLVPAQHPLAARDSVALSEVANEHWVLSAPNSCDQYQLALVACAAAGFTPRVTHEAKEWSGVAALVAHGFGICLKPRLIRVPAGLPVIEVPLHGEPTPHRRILSCIRRGSEHQEGIAAGLAALEETARNIVPDSPTSHNHADIA